MKNEINVFVVINCTWPWSPLNKRNYKKYLLIEIASLFTLWDVYNNFHRLCNKNQITNLYFQKAPKRDWRLDAFANVRKYWLRNQMWPITCCRTCVYKCIYSYWHSKYIYEGCGTMLDAVYGPLLSNHPSSSFITCRF